MKNKKHRNLNTAYVFTKNNQVYLKKDTTTEQSNNIDLIHQEWQPIHFQWHEY